MNKTLIILTLLFCGAMCHSCQSTKNIESENETMDIQVEIDEGLQTEIYPADTLILEIEEVAATDVFFTYERGYCFGMCPVFKSSIQVDGTVFYEGINFVDVMGKNTSLLSGADVKLIKDKLKEINYFELNKKYDNEMISDLPSIRTSAALGGLSNHVLDRYKAPTELRQLYKLIDDLYAPLDWTPITETE